MTIDPRNITKYDRFDHELEEFLLFCIMVAGKRADTTARCLDMFLNWIAVEPNQTPFVHIRRFRQPDDGNNAKGIKALAGAITAFNALHPGCGLGQQRRMAQAFLEAARSLTDLRTCELKDLMRIHGIGHKTARLFLLHSRKDARYAVLDTHLLKHLREHEDELGIDLWVPQRTPGNPKEYAALEAAVLRMADEAKMTPAEYDLHIWRKYAVGQKEATDA
jgi:thermostable 8-oxoguanine DNA glycosylase